MSEYNLCPRCSDEIGESTSCKCGWKLRKRKTFDAPRNSYIRMPCYQHNCGIDALCRILVDGLWVWMCWQHYEHHFLKVARDNCAAKGLHTTEQLRAAFKAQAATLVRHLTNREFLKQREPGEDYSEDATA